MNFESLFSGNTINEISGRYITLERIEPFLQQWNLDNQLKVEGLSVENRPIYSYTIGSGETKILIWSQMHGNESTTTKALLDFLNLLNVDENYSVPILKYFTFCCIPMLNPDGALAYTRENAAGVDLNRDALNLSQPESKILREVFNSFKPDICYNLHDQRTIFGVGDSGKPATVSFLAPAFNEAREIHHSRSKAIDIIAAMNEELQKYIPGQVGRFDDSFNINCVGDMFQFLNTPTILFEAGHYGGDYERDVTRKYIFIALLSGFEFISENVVVRNGLNEYLNIPQNNPCFYDFVYKNVKINYDSNIIITNFAAQFKEELIGNQLHFNAYVAKIGDLDNHFGHTEFNANEEMFFDGNNNFPLINQNADFNLGNNVKIINGTIKN